MNNLKTGSLEIQIEEIDGKNVMKWLGASQEPNPEKILNPYFVEIINELKEKELEIQFDKLVYINSAMVAPLVRFINALNDNQINTKIFYNKSSMWQQSSFKALAHVVKSMKFIKILE